MRRLAVLISLFAEISVAPNDRPFLFTLYNYRRGQMTGQIGGAEQPAEMMQMRSRNWWRHLTRE